MLLCHERHRRGRPLRKHCRYSCRKQTQLGVADRCPDQLQTSRLRGRGEATISSLHDMSEHDVVLRTDDAVRAGSGTSAGSSSSNSRDRKQVACTACRQQKARCGFVDGNANGRCARCIRLGQDCVRSDTFKRQDKRKRLSELEQEAGALKHRLRTADIATTATRVAVDVGTRDRNAGGLDAGFGRQASSTLLSHSSPSRPDCLNESTSCAEGPCPSVDADKLSFTVPQALNGYSLGSQAIDELFKLYGRRSTSLKKEES